MPELESLVAGWRRETAPLFPARDEVLDELECHLWDEIDRSCAAGLDAEAAFSRAVARLGPLPEVAAEFEKVPPVALPWQPVRVVWGVSAGVLLLTVWMIAPRLARGGVQSILAGHMGAVLLGYAASLLLGVLAICFLLARLIHEPGLGQRTTIRNASSLLALLAATLTGGGIALGIYCPLEKQGWCFGLDTREVGGLVIAAWDFLAAGVLFAHRRTSRILLPMTVASAGTVVVVLGWLVAARLESQLYGAMSDPLVLAFTLTMLSVLTLTALAPAGVLRLRGS